MNFAMQREFMSLMLSLTIHPSKPITSLLYRFAQGLGNVTNLKIGWDLRTPIAP